MTRWMKAALGTALLTVGLLLLLAGFIGLVLPGIVRNQAVKSVEAATGRKLTIGGVSLNPFTWTAEIFDLCFTEREQGETFAAFRRARIAVRPSSLLRWAPILAEARVTSPYLRVVRTEANAYNFSDLLKWLPRHLRISVSDLEVSDGSVDFIDQALAVEKRHELREVTLAVPFLSSLPSLADRYVTPRFSAVVNDAPCRVEGRIRPFASVVEASLTAELKDLDLPFYAAYFPAELPVRVESGTLSAKVAVGYRAAQAGDPELTLTGRGTLDGVKVADRTGAPVLALTQLEVGIADARPLAREFDLSTVSAEGLELFLSRDKEGVWSHTRLRPGAASGVLVTVAETRLRNGRFHFRDSLPPGGFAAELERVDLDVQRFSTSPGNPASYSLSFGTPRGEKGRLKGKFSPVPFATSSSVELSGLALEACYPYLAAVLGDKVKGRLDVVAHVDFGRAEGTRLEKVAVEARQLSAPFGKREGVTLSSLSLAEGKFTSTQNLLEIGEITLKDADVRISRDSNGALSPLTLFRRRGKEASRKQQGKPPLRYRIGAVSLKGGTLAFTDHHVAGGYSTALFKAGGRITGLSSQENRFADVDLRGRLENRSPLRIAGRINPLRDDLFTDLKVSFTDIELTSLTPYAGTYLGYAVDGGQLRLDLRYVIEKGKLDSEHKVVIEQLTFGKHIQSAQATHLPVRLAVALLKDRKGEIRLDVPVTGRIDDPQFSFWEEARRAFGNVLLKAATSPFALLRPLLGREEDFAIGFPYGSAELSPGEREKLLRLAAVLEDRPALKIAAVGFADAEREGEGKRILADPLAADQELWSLAEARAAVVKTFLIDEAKIDAARIFQKSGDVYRAPAKEGGVRSRVEFEVAAE
jgi:hypothetical protein